MHIRILAALALATVSASANGQPPQQRATTELGPILVTGDDAVGATLSERPMAIHTIGRQEIARSQARDLTELLRLVAGVEVARLGGPGQQQSIFLRGQDSSATIIALDGVRINSALGGAALQNIRPAMVERIEIFKGAAGTRYGPDAVGGAINIVTRRNLDGLSIRMGGGSRSTREAGVLLGEQTEAGYLQLGLDYLETDGIPTFDNSEDARGFRNTNLLTRAGSKVGGIDVDTTWLMQRGRTQYTLDGASLDPRAQDFRNDAVIVSLSEQLGEVNAQLTFSYTQDDLRQIQDAPNRSRTQRRGVAWRSHLPADGGHGIELSAAYNAETVAFRGFTDVTERRDFWHVAIADTLIAGAQEFRFAVGYLDDDAYGNKVTWSAEYQLRATDWLDLFALAGNGVRAPTALERDPNASGNPDLDAEQARNMEIGTRLRATAGFLAELRVFRIDTRKKITGFPPENIGRARNEGVELNTEFALYGFDTVATIVWQDPRDVRQDTPLLRRARRVATLRVDRPLWRLRLGAGVIASSARDDIDAFDFSPTRAPGYAIVNALATWQLRDGFDARLRVENIGDNDYQTVSGFRQPGRGYYAEIEYRLF